MFTLPYHGGANSEQRSLLWLTCAAHRITDYGSGIDEVVRVADDHTRDILKPGAFPVILGGKDRRYTQEIIVQCVYTRQEPQWESLASKRTAREGEMGRFRLQALTIILESGNLEVHDVYHDRRRKRLTVCSSDELWQQAILVPGTIEDGFKNAVHRWLVQQGFSLHQAKSILSSVNPAYICDAVRWLLSCGRLVGSFAAYTLAKGLLETCAKAPVAINSVLLQFHITDFQHAMQAAHPDHFGILREGVQIMENIGLPRQDPMKK